MLNFRSLVLAFAVAASACSHPDSPEDQIRKSLASMESAAEERDVSEVMEWVSPEFRSSYGQHPDELRQYLVGFFIANQSIHLLTRINAIDLRAPDEARVNVTVAMASREGDAADAWDLAAEVHDFAVTLRREDSDWKVIYLERGAR